MLRPFGDPDYVRELAAKNVTAIAFEGLPRTISAAQTMDAMTSQDNIAGYKAAVLAAATYGRFFPLLVTAAGTARPAQVLVLGAGVAGLQAIGTARRLGAVVTGYDIRPEAEGEITSLGAKFLRLDSGPAGSGTGGYARALTAEEQRAQQAELARHIARHDVVITTARVPGRPAAAARHRGRAQGHARRVGRRRHGREPARRQRRGLPPRARRSSPTTASR